MEWVVFSVFALAALAGAGGVVLSRKPVHCALSLVLTLFSVAVFFVMQGAHFLAAVQVIVYAGAIVILFLFVIMLLGIDQEEVLEEPLRGQRPLAVFVGVALFAGRLLVRRNALVMFMCVELMLNAVNLTFVTFARMLDDIGGQVFVFFTLVVAAAEVVIGLALIVSIFRRRQGATADDINLLRG